MNKMCDFPLSYREVVPDQTVSEPWKEITLNTGGTQSTLQDIKVSEKANGYCYEDSTKLHTRNRFISWRINNDVLELVEHSLDMNLTGNRIRYKIVDTPILDGVSIHESLDSVIVLVPTVCSVHRLVFPHPDRFSRLEEPNQPSPSIFSRATAAEAKNPATFHVFSNPNSDQLATMACSHLCVDKEDAYFVLVYPSATSSELLLIKQSSSGQCTAVSMKSETMSVSRFFSGFAGKLRGKGGDASNGAASSVGGVVMVQIAGELHVVTLSHGGHLKFWKTTGQCVAAVDVVAEVGAGGDRELLEGAALRKALNGYHSEENTLVVCLQVAGGCRFHVLKPTFTGQQLRIERLHTLHSPEVQTDLIDFALQPDRLWSAWRCEAGDSAVYSAALSTSSYATGNWTAVVLDAVVDGEQLEGDETDPKQVYLRQIFQPGRFPIGVIHKVLCIYRRSASTDRNLSTDGLRRSICLAVESEIRTMLDEQIVSDHDYVECAQTCWHKFYSCCVQYHAAGTKPLGLLLLPSVAGAILIKKSSFSFLRPLEPLEHLALCSSYGDQFANHPLLGRDPEGIADVLKLFEVLAYIDHQLSEAFAATFDREMSSLKAPDVAMATLLEQIREEMDGEFSSQLAEMLNQCGDLYKAVHGVLELLRYEEVAESSKESAFGSSLGVSFVSGCLRQQSSTRFSICRNLLLVCNVLLERKERHWGVLEALRSVCVPEIVVFAQASYALRWLGEVSVVPGAPDAGLQRLAPIKLPVYRLPERFSRSVSLLEMFASSSSLGRICGGKSEEDAFWHVSLLPHVNRLRQTVCPIGGSTAMAEWLLATGQHLALQQYVRLLGNWCEMNSCTRNFLLACSLLTSGENAKALDLFLTAGKGILIDGFLQERILRNEPGADSTAYVNYYLKVIQLFELHKARDCAIATANAALSIVDKSDPLMATLYSIKFKHHLALKHYRLAFDALNANPDAERRKDNLRDLVKCLLDEKKLDALLNFTYGGMEEFFTGILLARARAADAVDNIYYDFLYAHQIKRGPLCHRLAASVMYEQAFRLGQIDTPEALEKQVKCYLAAKNILHLCDPKFAWVVRPVEFEDGEEEVVIEPRAGSGTVEDLQVLQIRRDIEVINLAAIKKELLFASARLKLLRFNQATSVNVTTANELVLLLNNAGLFKEALKVCVAFDVPRESVFETLTKHCVLITEQHRDHPRAWEWLTENDLQDLPVKRECLADVVWQLLRDCLDAHESPQSSSLHCAVARKIVQMRAFLPHWLLESYKKRNAAELLRLLHQSGRLQEAYELAKDHLSAAMGYGKEHFGLVAAVGPTARPFCLPVVPIGNLVEEFRLQNRGNAEEPFAREYRVLEELFTKYLQTSERISCQVEREAFARTRALTAKASKVYF